jgi:hypothetical protein
LEPDEFCWEIGLFLSRSCAQLVDTCPPINALIPHIVLNDLARCLLRKEGLSTVACSCPSLSAQRHEAIHPRRVRAGLMRSKPTP